MLDILNKGVDTHVGPTCISETPKFSELAYQLIYSLCANNGTSTPTLRYLRTSHDFLYRHLQHVPFSNLVSMETEAGEPSVPVTSVLNQQSWLLKAAAIELRLTALGRQRSHTQRLLSLLFHEPSLPAIMSLMSGPDFLSRQLDTDLSTVDRNETGLQSSVYAGEASTTQRRKVLSIIESVDFSQEFPPRLQLNYFDVTVMEKAITSCEERSEESGVLYCNVPKLHKLLMTEVSGVQGTATAGQKNFLLQVHVGL